MDAVEGRDAAQLFCLEVFSGTAGVTAQLRQLGLKASFGVDRLRSKQALAPIVKLDLTKEHDQLRVLNLLEIPELIFVWMGPPCGTASLARAIRMDKDDHGPPELRTLEWPDGVPWIEQRFVARLTAANRLYSHTKDIVKRCLTLGILFVVENPKTSLFWETSFWKEVHDTGLIQYACHHACAYGSKRRKSTMLAFTFHLFAEVSARCDNKHEHEPWGLLADGTFATSAEVRYPRRLCQVVASVVGRMLLEAKVNFKGVDALSTFPYRSNSNCRQASNPGGVQVSGHLDTDTSSCK